MNATRSIFAFATVFAGFCSVGWLWEKQRAPDLAPAASAEPVKPSKATRRDGSTRSKMPPEVVARLAQVRAARTTEDRLRATIQLAQTLPLSEFQAWLDAGWFDGTEDMQDHLFHGVIRSRWLAEDPAGLMRYDLLHREHLYETSRALAKHDPSAAIDFLMEMQDTTERSRLIAYMSRDLAKANPDLVLSRLTELQSKLEGSRWNYLTPFIDELAQSSPDALKAATAEWPAALKKMVEEGMTYAKLKKNFTAAIEDLAGVPDGKQQFMSAVRRNPDFANLALKHPDQFPPGWLKELIQKESYYLTQFDTMKWLETDLGTMGLDGLGVRHLRLEAIGHLDPDELTTFLSGSGLAPDERRKAIDVGIELLATDPKAAEAWMAKLTDEKEIEIARKGLEQWEKTRGSVSLSPAGLITNLTDDDNGMNGNLASTAERWGHEEQRAAFREFSALPEDQKWKVAGKLADNDYEGVPKTLQAEVLAYMVAHPPAETGKASEESDSQLLLRKTSQLASSWAEQDPNAAGRWVTSLPSGEARLWAAKNLAARWNLFEPEDTRRWIGTLSGEEQAQVRAYLDAGGGEKD